MRISDAVADDVPLAVDFPHGTLNIVYRPTSFTPAEMDDLSKRERDVGAVVDSIRRLLVSWDLTDDSGEPISLVMPEPVEGQSPAEYDPLWKVPTNIFVAVVKAVNEDQNPGEASRP